MENSPLCNDKDIALQLRMSASWVRKQRWLRRRGEDHVLKIDPILVGSVPRYRSADVKNWIESLQANGGEL